MAEVMEVEGTVVEHGTFSTIEPPPEGTTRLTLHKHPASFEYAQIYLSGNMLTRAQLDAHFGQSVELPRMGTYSAYRVAYQVKVLGAPFSCAVIPAFDETPTPGASATEVLLRRDPA
jgi:hypothetical protein